jgi:hypothetical protein
MSSTGFIRRALPFFATFAVSIFIASFFVNVGFSRFAFEGRGWERHKRFERMAADYDQMRQERDQLRERVDTLENEHGRPSCRKVMDMDAMDDMRDLKGSVPPVEAPAPPPPPRVVPRISR